MIYFNKILSSLIGVVGWRQSTASGSTVVDAENLAASSGLYVQDANNLVNVANIKAAIDNRSATDEQINEQLRTLQKAGISNALTEVFSDYDVFASKLLYPFEADFNHEVELGKTGFAGFEIKTARRKDISVIVNKLITSFSSSGSLKILLFNAGTKSLIDSKTVTLTANGNDETIVDWILGYIIQPDSTYFIGYLLNDSVQRGFNREYEEAELRNNFNECVIRPIFVDGWTSETLFDVNDIEYVEDTWGLNFDISTVRDYSNIILTNKNRFAKVIQLSTAIEAIKFCSQTTNINSKIRFVQVRGNLTNVPEIANLYNEFYIELKSLKRLFSNREIEVHTLR